MSLHHEEAASPYRGQGTEKDPYVVEFLPGDRSNPLGFAKWRKWLLTFIVTMSAFAISLTSSAYTVSTKQVTAELHTNSEVFNAGVALYVFGFALGPAIWAPLSEIYGRRPVFVLALGVMTAFVGATAGAPNIASVLAFRLLTAIFGAAPLTNAGGTIADLFPVSERGFAMSMFATAPFMGPVLGPIVGGFITITVGWRWVQGVCCILMGAVWISGTILLPETYAPAVLKQTAKRLTKETGKVHISVLEKTNGGVQLKEVFGKALKRPWALLFWEPIVLISSIYMAILYGILYMFFPAFPIVYEELRGWNAGIGSLAFLGLAVGMILGLIYTITDDELRYHKLGDKASPEGRLPPAMIGAVALPIGMFAFAWTNGPEIHWSASIILSAPFGFGMVTVFIALFNYQLDSYSIYAASVLAAGAMLRAFVGAAFPLFTTYMFQNLGIHWASSVPGFLCVACLPFPFVMYRYGTIIRTKCKYAHEAAVLMARMQGKELDDDHK